MPRRGRKWLVGPVEDIERREREHGYERLRLWLRLDWLTRLDAGHELEELTMTGHERTFD